MAAETQYTANTGVGQAVTANTALDGTGTLATILTAAANGTLIKSVTIKSIGTTTEGMVRLFLYDGTNTRLLQEIHVPANTPSATNPAFEYTWNCDVKLKATWILKATTQTGDDFNVIAEGLDWAYFTSSVRPESTNYTANTAVSLITTANTSLSGSGTLNTDIWTVLTAATSASGSKGTKVESITIKAIGTTTMGMVRLFLYDGSNARLITEIPVPAITQSGTEMTFERKITLGNFNLKADWSIRATTEKTESFAITVEANDWKYPAATRVTNYTPASGTAVTTEEKLHSLQVPANVFATGDLLQVCASVLVNNGAETKTFRMYVNTGDTLTAATLLGTVTLTTTVSGTMMRLFPVISDTALEVFGSPSTSVASNYNQTTGTSANVTVPSVSAGFWVLISGQKANSADTDTVRWSIAQKVGLI